MDIATLLIQNGFLSPVSKVFVQQLTGGFWSEVFRVQGNKLDWIIKLSQQGQNEGLHPVLPSAEWLALQSLKHLQIAPLPIGFFQIDSHKFILIYEYIRGQFWESGISSVATKLSELHNLSVDELPSFRKLFFTPEDVLKHADSFLLQVCDDEMSTRLKQLRPALVDFDPPTKLSLIHGDIHPSNIIIDRNNDIYLIDWQSPGIGDPVQDLHAFLSPMFKTRPLSKEEIQSFFETYGNVEVRQRLEKMSPFYSYRVAAHCLLRRQHLRESKPIISERYKNHCLTAMKSLC